MDAHGDIGFHKLFEWMLPTFEGVSFYEFLSARMRNYMLHSIKDKGWTPVYYRPADGRTISADDVVHFFGCQLACSLRGNPSIRKTGQHAIRLTPSAHAWNACPGMRSETSTHVYILMTIGTGTTNGVMCTRTVRNAVRKARQNTARSSPCSRMVSTVDGRSAQFLDAS
jgi:hypothetical protein